MDRGSGNTKRRNMSHSFIYIEGTLTLPFTNNRADNTFILSIVQHPLTPKFKFFIPQDCSGDRSSIVLAQVHRFTVHLVQASLETRNPPPFVFLRGAFRSRQKCESDHEHNTRHRQPDFKRKDDFILAPPNHTKTTVNP